MVAVHASIWNEKLPVQPHKVETQVELAQSRGVSGTPEWASDEDWTSERAKCQALEDQKRFVTFLLKSVNLKTKVQECAEKNHSHA